MRSSKRLKVKTCSTYNWWAISSFMGLLLLITFWQTREKENFRQMENIALLWRYYFPFPKHLFCFIFSTLICILCMKEATQIITLLLQPTTFPGLEEYIMCILCTYAEDDWAQLLLCENVSHLLQSNKTVSHLSSHTLLYIHTRSITFSKVVALRTFETS